MVTAREIVRGRVNEDNVPHTKEFGHDSIHKDKLLQVFKSEHVWYKEF